MSFKVGLLYIHDTVLERGQSLSFFFFLSPVSLLSEFAADNVRYLELRTTLRPKEVSGFGKEEYLLTVLDEIDRTLQELNTIVVRLVVSVDRRQTLEDALDTMELAHKHRQRGIVGVDLCGDPTVWLAFPPPQFPNPTCLCPELPSLRAPHRKGLGAPSVLPLRGPESLGSKSASTRLKWRIMPRRKR